MSFTCTLPVLVHLQIPLTSLGFHEALNGNELLFSIYVILGCPNRSGYKMILVLGENNTPDALGGGSNRRISSIALLAQQGSTKGDSLYSLSCASASFKWQHHDRKCHQWHSPIGKIWGCIC